MIQGIIKLFDIFNAYAAKNQFVAGALSLWGLGVVSYLCKDIPKKFWGVIKKFFTTTVTITNQNEIFFSFLRWYEKNGYAKKGRYLKISNGKWGDGGLIKSVGYGKHYFWYKKRLIVLHMFKVDATATSYDKDEINMVTLGRSYKIFDEIFEEVVKNESKKDRFVIKKFSKSYWICSSEQRPRLMDTIFLDYKVKDNLMSHLDKFRLMEDWYLKNGIPYQTGILLYGPPGTGKTSIIKAMAYHLGYTMHILSASTLVNIEDAMFKLPEKSLIIIEDIDTNSALKKRMALDNMKKEAEKVKSDKEDAEVNKEEERRPILFFDFNNLSDVLNAIDGVQSNHGRILVLTTNDINKLDSALLRPGRIDLMVKIGYVNKYILQQFFEKFYPKYKFPLNFEIKGGVSSAVVQNLILENLNNPEKVLDSLRRDESE